MSRKYASRLAGAIAASFIGVVGCALAYSYYLRHNSEEQHLSSARQAAVQICSGVDDPSLTNTLGIASCMTYIRGFVSGYNLSSVVDTDPSKLICVPPTATNEQLLEDVLSWAEHNVDQLDADIGGQPVVIAPTLVIYGLQKNYACKAKKKV